MLGFRAAFPLCQIRIDRNEWTELNYQLPAMLPVSWIVILKIDPTAASKQFAASANLLPDADQFDRQRNH